MRTLMLLLRAECESRKLGAPRITLHHERTALTAVTSRARYGRRPHLPARRAAALGALQCKKKSTFPCARHRSAWPATRYEKRDRWGTSRPGERQPAHPDRMPDA